MKPGDLIRFTGEQKRYTVMAADDRWVILTKPFNARKTYLYTIVDKKERIRGRCDLIFGPPAQLDTSAGAAEALELLRVGKMGVSRRRHKLLTEEELRLFNIPQPKLIPNEELPQDFWSVALQQADRRDFLCINRPTCPHCNSGQVELRAFHTAPAQWRCRMCHNYFTFEPKMEVIKVYVASKTAHAKVWKAYRNAYSHVEIISTWIDEAGPGESRSLSDLWLRCIGEARSCDILMLYVESGEQLKGALVEVGAALAHGRIVYVVSQNITEKEIGSWVNHPLVFRFDSLSTAFHKIAKLTKLEDANGLRGAS